MIVHIWSVLCSRSSIDSQRNNISLFEVLEQITIEEPVPSGQKLAIPLSMEIVSLWQRSDYNQPARGRGRITLQTLGSNSYPSGAFEINITADGIHRFRSVVNSIGLPIDGFGIYRFVVELQQDGTDTWDTVAQLPLEVRGRFAEATASQAT